MASKDFCNDPACDGHDRMMMLELSGDLIRTAVANSSHVSIDLVELLAAFIVAARRTSGFAFSEDTLSEALDIAEAWIARDQETSDFEAEALSGISDIPVVDKEPRVLISRADIDSIAKAVSEGLRP